MNCALCDKETNGKTGNTPLCRDHYETMNEMEVARAIFEKKIATNVDSLRVLNKITKTDQLAGRVEGVIPLHSIVLQWNYDTTTEITSYQVKGLA